MNIVLTGSLGHISKPLALELIHKGHQVTIISTKAERKAAIQQIGAEAAIGSIHDLDFLIQTFTGADAVYCMFPPPNVTHELQDIFDEYIGLAENYKTAIQRTGVKKVVDLSTVGAHMDKGNGLLHYGYEIEKVLQQLPMDIHIKFMRPVGFYYNLLAFIPQIKAQGFIATNYGGPTIKPWVSPLDIAAAVSSALLSPFDGRKIKYVVSEELSCDQVARILGNAIGLPDLKWHALPDNQVLDTYIKLGMAPSTAKGFVEMNASMQTGRLYEDYKRQQPYKGQIKMAEFAQEFAKTYQQ